MSNPLQTNPLQTKNDLSNALHSILDPLASYTSPGGAQIHLGSTATHFDTVAASLEGFSRPLWGLASLLSGGGSYSRTSTWIRGFEHGTDPDGEEFWGYTKGKDQRMVEMAAIGFTLAVAKEGIWDELSEKGKENLTNWLSGINDKDMPNSTFLRWMYTLLIRLQRIGFGFACLQTWV